MNFIDGMLGHSLEDIFEPFPGVDIEGFAGSEEGIDHGDSLCSGMGACEKVVFASQRQWANDVFNFVVIDFHSAIAEIMF